MRFLSNFGCKIIFMRYVDFWQQQDYNSLFKGSIGHVTSKWKWPISCVNSSPCWKQELQINIELRVQELSI